MEVAVDKELEYLARPMQATTGGASFRNDDSLYRYGTPLPTLGQQVGDQPRPVAAPTPNAGWIPLGRDPLLEQRILGKLLAKLGVPPVLGDDEMARVLVMFADYRPDQAAAPG